ncbi:hypothetical protein [Metamycoplasma neophronis]|uniref:Uncharacterized protein n=1 Tax=Metamycoplasma neophronis TaxID=872983 RepID=A0ABY2Z0T9_9BACT|nr:hypothetical protein [Metamycoplasma neophronis]TPR53878.1 hypothetical protein FJR74_01800 [Metamycoplasma neophronis]
MLLKYTLLSEIDTNKGEEIVLETEFVPYEESTEGRFIRIHFKDENSFECDLKAALDEVFLSYAGQNLHMIKNQRVSNKLKISETQDIAIDFYLKNVSILEKEIILSYDLLQGDKIVVKNTAKWTIE